MNLIMVVRVLGILLLCDAAAMLPAIPIARVYGEDTIPAFLLSVLITAVTGILLCLPRVRDNVIRYKEGFAIVTFGWLLVSAAGALPFLFTGVLPSFVDAFFESVSGFSTTGATVITNVEIVPYSLLFWRSLTHWLGGMGILVLALAVLPALGIGTFQILKAESPGPVSAKLTPRVSGTAKILYSTYLVITLVQIMLLKAGGMPWFDSVVNSFATLGTGGYAIKNASIGAYNNVYFEIVIAVFMILAGVNFSLYYLAVRKKSLSDFFHDTEFRIYLIIIIAYILLITLNIYGHNYSSLAESLRHASFQVASIITTTGFATTNFDRWPDFSRALLLTLMFIGACAGSTGGGMKVIRIYLLFKYIRREVNSLIHPRAVKAIKVNNIPMQESVLTNVAGFFVLYFIIFVIATLLMLTQKYDMITSFSAVAASLGNIGPGLGLVGPSTTFAGLTAFSKILLSFCMILGRLEIYTVIALLFPQTWKR
ncbi:MAG TPA: TrkH family potassium uptake protein [Firmicutes bacterium]|nr:TrkH family potassium uptake protein [Bacillota bacterium]